MSDLRTCRICHNSNYEHNHPAAKSVWIKIGPRHSAHLKCLVSARGGEQLLRDLKTHELDALPFFEIRELGLESALRAELERRKAAKAEILAALSTARPCHQTDGPTTKETR